MKYEYLCGCESDFFTMPENIIAVVQLDHCVQGLTEFSQITECGKPVIAIRRIIRTPTWTVADQKAQREEDEFVASVIDLASENQLMSCGFKDGVIAAYRKLKGGE